jgi:hypothetical protein
MPELRKAADSHPLVILKLETINYQNDTTMAAAPVFGVSGPVAGGPPVPRPLAPPLPFPGDPASINGWLIDQSLFVTSSWLVNEIEAGFARLSQDIPEDTSDPNNLGAMRGMVDEVLNSDGLCCYLTKSETGVAAIRVVAVHSIREYSAGFGP